MEACRSPRTPPFLSVEDIPPQAPPTASMTDVPGNSAHFVYVSDRTDDLGKCFESLQQQLRQTVREEIEHVRISQERIERLLTHGMNHASNGIVKINTNMKCESVHDRGSMASVALIACQSCQSAATDDHKIYESAMLNSRKTSSWHKDASTTSELERVLSNVGRRKMRPAASVLMNQELEKSHYWHLLGPFRSFAEGFVTHRCFDAFFGVLIVCNSVAIGAEIEYKTAHASPSLFFTTLSLVFASFFTLELLCRLAANYMSIFFCGPEYLWNLFDVVMVVVSLVEVADSAGSAGGRGGRMGVLRIVRMVRLMRIIRVMRFVPQLRMMIFMIFESLKSLCWLLVILVTILYVFAIVFTMGATEYLGVSEDPNNRTSKRYSTEIATHYGTLVRSIYSCFKAITSGQSWGEMLDPLVDVSAFYVLVFLFYITFSILALLNIVTGVFVDGAMEKSRHDKNLVVQREIAAKKAAIQNLKSLFEETDVDNSGAISLTELQSRIQDPRFESYLEHLNIDTSDSKELFEQLDRDGDGNIDMGEFVECLTHLVRGQTVEQFVQKLLKEQHIVKKHVSKAMRSVHGELQTIRAFLVRLAPPHQMCEGP